MCFTIFVKSMLTMVSGTFAVIGSFVKKVTKYFTYKVLYNDIIKKIHQLCFP